MIFNGVVISNKCFVTPSEPKNSKFVLLCCSYSRVQACWHRNWTFEFPTLMLNWVLSPFDFSNASLQRTKSSSFTFIFKKLCRINFGQTLCREIRETPCLKSLENEIYFPAKPTNRFLLGHVPETLISLTLAKRDTKHPYLNTHSLLHRSLMHFLDTEVNRFRFTVHGMYRMVR